MQRRQTVVQVLNLSSCSLGGSLSVAGLVSLRALILNNNELESVTGSCLLRRRTAGL